MSIQKYKINSTSGNIRFGNSLKSDDLSKYINNDYFFENDNSRKTNFLKKLIFLSKKDQINFFEKVFLK